MSVPTDSGPKPAAGAFAPLELTLADGGGTDEHGRTEKPAGVLRRLELGFLLLDRIIGRYVPEPLNPLLHTGAIAVSSFLVAAVTGIVLLLWYQPSVHQAYSSVDAMSGAPLTAGLVRSLHRYSSDAVMFFGLVHAVRMLFERRFGGARWLAWVTGVLMMAILWFTGWTGYWLVWDLRAQWLAIGTARVIDVLPILAEPLGRSFLTDEEINSLLFFVVFFFHMLIPLAMGVVMWIHITRLSRARFLTNRVMTTWLLVTFVALSLVYPATSAAPARMTALPEAFSMDWWYLMPIWLTDRVGGGPLWALGLFAGVALISVPWWLERRRLPAATVVVSRCNECTKCYQDCPYEAIQMVPRSDGNTKFLREASVIESKCVACGICAGSCDTAGIGVDWFGSIDQRRRIEEWLEQATAAGETAHMAFACAESAGGALDIDDETGICAELPGYRVLRVPCAGWLHPLLIERALRNGAAGVAVVSCGPGECHYREGADWERQRLAGEREPVLRKDKVSEDQVVLIEVDRTRKQDLIEQARAFRSGSGAGSLRAAGYSPAPALVAAVVLSVVFAGVIGLVSDAVYAAPRASGSELVVSFKHPGAVSENCRTLGDEELAAKPVHMRKSVVCARERASVRLEVRVDGNPVVEKSFAPTGIWGDGNSVAIERIPVPAGEHRVEVAIGDSHVHADDDDDEDEDEDEWSFRDERTLDFSEDARRVVLFDRVIGFTWR